MSKEPVEIVGIGNAIVDVLSKSDDAFLQQNSLNKGAMTLIEEDQAEALYQKMGPGTAMSGGSAANTIAAFAAMGGRAGYIGKISNDQLGHVFRHDICASGVRFTTAPLEDGPSTARCLILITPDAQRTMCTYLGACVWIAPSDLDEAMIAEAGVTYLEGYLFDRPRAKQTFRRAADVAHAAGKKVALSLSDSFCVERHRDEFLDLVENHVDILFANESEIMALYKTEDFDRAVWQVREHCELAALTRSEKGSVIVTKDSDPIVVPVVPVAHVVDTTGAGDMYAAGFLFGHARGMPLAECGYLGSLAAAEVIAHVGARPQSDLAALVGRRKAG
ncbi:MAG: adenosine kinase [Alphaproteobacteria bacterium]|nr:adenosine kinase [Alphaproteobacteria bacterium]